MNRERPGEIPRPLSGSVETLYTQGETRGTKISSTVNKAGLAHC